MSSFNHFKKGDRVTMSTEGRRRFPKHPGTGVVATNSRRSSIVRVQGDGQKYATAWNVAFWEAAASE